MFTKSQLKLPFGIHSNFPMGGKISSFMCQTLYIQIALLFYWWPEGLMTCLIMNQIQTHV